LIPRLSLQEKLYQRELEAAIEASIKDSQSSDEHKEVIQLSDTDSPVKNKPSTEQPENIVREESKENLPSLPEQDEKEEKEASTLQTVDDGEQDDIKSGTFIDNVS